MRFEKRHFSLPIATQQIGANGTKADSLANALVRVAPNCFVLALNGVIYEICLASNGTIEESIIFEFDKSFGRVALQCVAHCSVNEALRFLIAVDGFGRVFVFSYDFGPKNKPLLLRSSFSAENLAHEEGLCVVCVNAQKPQFAVMHQMSKTVEVYTFCAKTEAFCKTHSLSGAFDYWPTSVSFIPNSSGADLLGVAVKSAVVVWELIPGASALYFATLSAPSKSTISAFCAAQNTVAIACENNASVLFSFKEPNVFTRTKSVDFKLHSKINWIAFGGDAANLQLAAASFLEAEIDCFNEQNAGGNKRALDSTAPNETFTGDARLLGICTAVDASALFCVTVCGSLYEIIQK